MLTETEEFTQGNRVVETRFEPSSVWAPAYDPMPLIIQTPNLAGSLILVLVDRRYSRYNLSYIRGNTFSI